ncbi:hypothetical protein DAPPUDRAFT_257295 [Daphnia pulex]|uniref:Uncharacterized protein n=1 Tax=Daphnia pulex TaxID=6669 RepID=E9HDA3_DAPPU|nr:hypothetical protein DAPPUDRAFT_257295 [Daphnia pulex]|eukprot:EFX70282.1 hypothetical protein DAPPUDRAFT_257295 [Daphnia pulex]
MDRIQGEECIAAASERSAGDPIAAKERRSPHCLETLPSENVFFLGCYGYYS